jgi:hypothetical protein
VVSKIFWTGAAIYPAVVVARSTGPKRPNFQFRVPLRHFAATAWKRAKTSPRTLPKTDLALSPWQRPSHSSVITQQFLAKYEMTVIPHPTYSPDLTTRDFFPFPKMKLKQKGRRFDTKWGDPGRIVESAWHYDGKELPGSVPKMEEMVGPVSTCGRELLRGWWRPIGLMVSFMIFTASVRNILDTPSYTICINLLKPSDYLTYHQV